MILIKFLSYILCSYGISCIVVYSNGPFHIFEKWRNFSHSINEQFGELFTCMMCFSTWVGLALSLINSLIFTSVMFTPFNIILGGTVPFWVIMVFDMGFTCAVVWLLHQLEEMMERTGSNNYSYVDDDVTDGQSN